MSTSSITEQFLKEIEARTGLPVHVFQDNRLQPPFLVRMQMARRGASFHQLATHPQAGAIGDYQAAHQCSFILRHYAVPSYDRRTLAPSDEARKLAAAWVREVPACAAMAEDRQASYADGLQGSLLNMLRSIPIGMRIDQDLRMRFPELHDVQQQSLRRQLEEHATILKPDIRKTIPPSALRLNLSVNAAFARFCSVELNDPGLVAPYEAEGCLVSGDSLFQIWKDTPTEPKGDQQLVQSWAEALGLAAWIRWLQ